MRRKKLISPEKPIQESIEYRFKILFLPSLSYVLAVTVLGSFLAGIFIVVQNEPIIKAIIAIILISLCLLILELLMLWYMVKKYDLIMNTKNISGVGFWYYRQCISWQNITLVKHHRLLGLRCLDIRTADGKNILMSPCYYRTDRILDRVRELAGAEHILVRALEKELSRPRYELTKIWCWTIGSIALTIGIYLISGNMYAAAQEKPLEREITSYVNQHPKTAPNQSAIDLQALMTKFGLSVDAFGDGSEVKVKPDKAAIAEWKAIEPIFNKYLDKQKISKESIEPVPENLTAYLKHHQADINAIETHLINSPVPEWGSDSAWIEKRDPNAGDSPISLQWMKKWHLYNIENLIIVNIIDKQKTPGTEILRDLVAIDKIQQSLQAQPSLGGQIFSLIAEHQIAKVVKHIDTIPLGWGNNLFSLERHKQMRNAIVRQSLITVRVYQSSPVFERLLNNTQSPLRFIPGFYMLARPQIRLNTIDWYRDIQQGLVYWEKQNICHAHRRFGARSKTILGIEGYVHSSDYLLSEYIQVLRQDLHWELTTSIRQVKAKLAAEKKADLVAKDFNIASKVCPGERWNVKVTDGAVSIEFSHPPDWKALGINNPVDIETLTYKIRPIS
jgi:hypothetical protein